KSMSGMVWLNALLPRSVMDAMSRALKGDQVLTNPDHAARAAYEARIVETVAQAEQPAQTRETETV
ncbi:MAG: hypothetical protein ACXVQR_08540, partial [Solirubrobacteraceae bacterium]